MKYKNCEDCPCLKRLFGHGGCGLGYKVEVRWIEKQQLNMHTSTNCELSHIKYVSNFIPEEIEK